MNKSILIISIVVRIVILVAPSICFADERVAILIGNNNYPDAPLSCPRSDAQAMNSIFKKYNYNTALLVDAGYSEMNQALNRNLESKSKIDTIVFFFSGHGFEVNGKNYLVPIDGVLYNDNSMQGMYSVDLVLKKFSGINASRKIIILDCCRSNPKADQSKTIIRASQKGLVAINKNAFPSGGALIVFSTSPGSFALDCEQNNSPFTTELIRQLKPGRDAISLFTSVTAARYKNQEAWISFDGAGQAFSNLSNYDILGQSVVNSPPRRDEYKPESNNIANNVPTIRSYWNHNGSKLGLLADGAKRTLVYVDVNPKLQGIVEPGAVLFSGTRVDGGYVGTARRFKRGLRPNDFNVSGPVFDDDKKIQLRGEVKLRDPSGALLLNNDGTPKTEAEVLEFTYLANP